MIGTSPPLASDVHAVTRLVAAHTGIDLERGGQAERLSSFVRDRTRSLRLASAAEYLAMLSDPRSQELQLLINAITVGYTWFYRDARQLEAIARLLESEWRDRRTLRIWIAGCSTGEDAYTLAMLLERSGRRGEILGTDINTEALEHARRGCYREWSLRDLPAALRRCFDPDRDGRWEVTAALRERVQFARHSLTDAAPTASAGARWDLILCRNVLIYFRAEDVQRALRNMGSALSAHGALVLGPTELAFAPSDRLVLARREGIPVLVPAGAHPPSQPPPPSSSAAPADVRAASLRTLILQGEAQLAAGDFQQAIATFAKILAEDPLSTDALLGSGIALYMASDFDGAVQMLKAALFLDSSLWPASWYLGLAYENLGQPVEAGRAYRSTLECDRVGASGSQLVLGLNAWREEIASLARRRILRLGGNQPAARSVLTPPALAGRSPRARSRG